MLRFMATFGLATVMLVSGSSSAHALIGMLLPAIQKVRATSSGKLYVATDVGVYLEVPEDREQDPVLMVISNQDFYSLDIFDMQFIGSGQDAKVVLTGLAELRSADSKETQSCFSVVTLSADPDHPDQLQLVIEAQDEKGNTQWLEVFTCPDDGSFTVTLEYLVLMT